MLPVKKIANQNQNQNQSIFWQNFPCVFSDGSFHKKQISRFAIFLTETRKQIPVFRNSLFQQFEQFLTYKAKLAGGDVIKVSANYTSQRCPKCGGIHKEFRHHDTHEYVCENCGYRANDDLTGARNIYLLGTLYVSGVENPKFGKPKAKAKTKEKVAN